VQTSNAKENHAMPTKMSSNDRVADAIRDTLCSPNVSDSNFEPANVVDALESIARALRQLGFYGPGDNPGAIEGHSMMLRDGAARISESLGGIASAITDLAEAIREHK
jgi:hypothetical protein